MKNFIFIAVNVFWSLSASCCQETKKQSYRKRLKTNLSETGKEEKRQYGSKRQYKLGTES